MKYLKKNLFSLIAFVIAAIFIGFIFKDFEFKAIEKGLKQANYFWIVAVFIVTILSYWVRAIRWNILLEPMNLKISNWNAFLSIAVGYFFNLGIPRSGEIVRATTLYKLEKVPLEKSIASVVLERLVDLVMLLLFIALNVLFNYEVFMSFLDYRSQPKNVTESSHLGLYIAIGFLFLTVLLLFVFRQKMASLSVFKKAKRFLQNFYEGLFSIFKLKRSELFFLYSVLLWVCYFFMTYLVVLAFEETHNIPFQFGIFLLVSGSFGVIFPAAGGLGYPVAQKFAFKAIYIALGLSAVAGEKVGYMYGFLSYFFQLMATIVLGVFALFFVSRKKISVE